MTAVVGFASAGTDVYEHVSSNLLFLVIENPFHII